MLLKFMALAIVIVPMVSPQGSRGGNVLHQEESADVQSVIVTPRTRSFLSCESGEIVVKVNFTQPFRGLMYAHRSRSSPCRVHGNGEYYYELRIPLKGCGTWQETPRVFVNNVTVRFHPALELEEDETKTVVCRYPPPLTPPPGIIQIVEPVTVSPVPVPTRARTARLSEVEILIIICLLLFLSLLTLGIGIAYFCLKRRNIHIVRKSHAYSASSAPPSQITRLSSSALHPPSSLLSSVLGHTVRIPRAVPYSAPAPRTASSAPPSPEDHAYEAYPVSSESTSAEEPSETSVSSSSDDQRLDASKQLLHKKGGPRSILSIPKAILRKTNTKAWQTEPTLHSYQTKASTVSVGTSVRKPELEDQSITTVLEAEAPEDENGHRAIRNVTKDMLKNAKASTNQGADTKAVPVYAQVDKNKKTSDKKGDAEKYKFNIPKLEAMKTHRAPPRCIPLPGAVRRQRVIEDIPEESSTSEEVTKNTTVTTSVRREVTETRILPPGAKEGILDGQDTSKSSTPEVNLPSSVRSSADAPEQQLVPHQPAKSILIRDVSDIYLTTTVETESRELKTLVSRDVIEEHSRTTTPSSPVSSTSEISRPKEGPKMKIPLPTDKWNVVIRHRPPPSIPTSTTDLDTLSESSADSADTLTQAPQMPKLDVKIRIIPPGEVTPSTNKDKPEELVSIPLLEMPESISKLKEALMPKAKDEELSTDEPVVKDDAKKQSEQTTVDVASKTAPPARTVRWKDDAGETSKDKDSTVSSSDSYRSTDTLRERSSSEVLEVAPTLPSQRGDSGRAMLERSTSEIVTSPDDHVRWVGGVVPVLESLSPEFLANMPVVIQGGFFNRQQAANSDNKQQDRKSISQV